MPTFTLSSSKTSVKTSSKLFITTLACVALLSSCGTGIDSTRRITADEVERSVGPQTDEERLLADIGPEPFALWQPGKLLVVTDDRLRLMLNNTAPSTSLLADTLAYTGATDRTSPTGARVADLTFTTRSGHPVTYTSRSDIETMRAAQAIEIPFTIELSTVEAVRSRLLGRKLWVLVPDRFNTDGSHLRGRKYIVVTVKDVVPGNTIYPVAVIIDEDDTAAESMVYMSVGPTTAAHRRFANLFSLSDPRLKYPSVSDANWSAIVSNSVLPGMTREECRLAWGAPATIDRGPTGGGYITEVWGYDNGAYLIFEDGLLREHRR